MKNYNQSKQDKFYEQTIKTIGKVAKLPMIRVNRKKFLKKQFAGSPYLNQIIKEGPQSVYSTDELREMAREIIKTSTTKSATASFVAGLPSTPLTMIFAGGADVAQYFAFAINMAQQIAYLFGEDELFSNKTDELSEEAKMRIVAYLGAMFGAGGAALLVTKVSKKAGENLGKTFAAKALTSTVWFPLMRKTGALIGKEITKKSVEKTVTKTVPIIGGMISGGITYLTFIPMGNRLVDTFVRHLNGEFDHLDTEIQEEMNVGFFNKLANKRRNTHEILNKGFIIMPNRRKRS